MLKQLFCLCAIFACCTGLYAEGTDLDNQAPKYFNAEIESEDESVLSCDRCCNVVLIASDESDSKDGDSGELLACDEDDSKDGQGDLYACDDEECNGDVNELFACDEDDADNELFAFDDEVDQQGLGADEPAFAQGDDEDDNLFYAVAEDETFA